MEEEPKKTTGKWITLYLVTGIVDLIQIIIDATGVGVIVSEALELAMPFVIVILLTFFKIITIKRFISVLAADGFDALTGGGGPFWIADAGYIHFDVLKSEAAAKLFQAEQNALQNFSSRPVNQEVGGVGVRLPDSQRNRSEPRLLNEFDNIRSPSGRSSISVSSTRGETLPSDEQSLSA